MIPIGDEPRQPGHFAWVTYAIVLANIAVYQFTTHATDDPEALGDLFRSWGYIPAEPSLTALLTCQFMHADPVHLIGNMLFLGIFGPNVEWSLGRVGYALGYLLAGAAASLVDAAFRPDSMIPGVGASGAISGVLAFYVVAFPQNRVRIIVWLGAVQIWRIPAWLYIAIFVLWDNVLPIVQGAGESDGVGYWAHVGGFATGLLAALILTRWVGARDARPKRSWNAAKP